MSLRRVLRRQWLDYPKVHKTRANFVVHLITVPIFMAGTVSFFFGLCALSPALTVAGLAGVMVTLGTQGWGHRQEPSAPAPFTSRIDAVVRIVFEQWVTFPRYAFYKFWCFVCRRENPARN